MAKKLTDPTIAKLVNIAANDRMHIIDTDDPTHDPAGTSKYIEMQDLAQNLAKTTATGIIAGSIFPIFAEENGPLGANLYEWSFGNGDDSQSGFGIVLPFDVKLVALTLNIRQGSAAVEARKNTASVGLSVTADAAVNTAGFAIAPTPILFNAGDVIGFLTLAATGVTEGGKVAAWFKTV